MTPTGRPGRAVLVRGRRRVGRSRLPGVDESLYWLDLDQVTAMGLSDVPLAILLAECSPGNRQAMQRALTATLPYLETHVRLSLMSELLPDPPLVRQLHEARVNAEVRPELAEMLSQSSVPNNVASFLASWARREFDVVCADPSVSSPADRRR